jgi:CRP-like cAMP-binding protein
METTTEPRISAFRHADNFESYLAGEPIFKEGEPGGVMYVVKQGTVNVLVRGKVVDTIGEGGLLGEMVLIDRQPRSATAIAADDCQLVPVDERRFLHLVQQTPHFALEVMRVMAWRLRNMNELA